MPAHSDITSTLERQLLLQLGLRLKEARRRLGLSSADLARHVGISRTTLQAVEAGEPSPAMGTYVRVLAALGMSADLALLAAGVPSSSSPCILEGHAVHDLSSLMLHKEAVKLLRRDPGLVTRAAQILDRWRQTGDPNSLPLWDEWARILARRDWKRILANTESAKQLRQASPLSTLLPQEVRERVQGEIRELKARRRMPAARSRHASEGRRREAA